MSTESKSIKNLAHPGKRFQGQFIDGVIAYFIGFLSFYLLLSIMSKESALMFGLLFGGLYFLLSDALPNGQSIGKRILRIKVVNDQTMQPAHYLNRFYVISLFH